MRAAGQGLAPLHCKYHVQRKSRHGSYWHPGYHAADLKLYLRAAARWIAKNKEAPYVQHAVSSLDSLLQTAGYVPNASSPRLGPPKVRSKIAFARLRDKGVSPPTMLTSGLAVAMLIEDDPTSDRTAEFRTVQIAKAIHRKASGFHRRYDNGYEIHTYPRSSGRVLRHMGMMIEECLEFILVHHLPALLAFKIETYGKHPAVADPSLSRSHIAQPGQPSASRAKPKPKVREEVHMFGSLRVVRRIIVAE
jgi:hypothetical protein